MNTNELVSALDVEISRLEHIRGLLVGAVEPAKRRGRPKGSTNKPATAIALQAQSRTMSAEGRARIAAAQRSRWAKRNALAEAAVAVGKKGTSKQTPTKGTTPAVAKIPKKPGSKRVGRPPSKGAVAGRAAGKRTYIKRSAKSNAGQPSGENTSVSQA